jgi:hypothetical protein
MGLRTSLPDSASAFAKWLTQHPVAGDQPFGGLGVRYQVARYCEYLATNPWPGGDPLADEVARDGAVNAYRSYLDTFNTGGTATIGAILVSLDRFYGFLGLGPARLEPITWPRGAASPPAAHEAE